MMPSCYHFVLFVFIVRAMPSLGPSQVKRLFQDKINFPSEIILIYSLRRVAIINASCDACQINLLGSATGLYSSQFYSIAIS